MDKVVFVKSYFVAVGKTEKVKVPTGEKGWGGEKFKLEERWVQTGYSDCDVDTQRLEADVQKAVVQLDKEGYEIISLSPVTSGNYHWELQGGGYSWGYGYSYTKGIMIAARLMK